MASACSRGPRRLGGAVALAVALAAAPLAVAGVTAAFAHTEAGILTDSLEEAQKVCLSFEQYVLLTHSCVELIRAGAEQNRIELGVAGVTAAAP